MPMAVPLKPHQLLPPMAPSSLGCVSFGPKSAVDSLREGLAFTAAPSILGPRPATSAPARRRKTLPPGFTPRRSARISKINDGKNIGPVQRAQTVLLRRMGVIKPEEHLSRDALEAYLKLFDKPLALHHIRAVTALFDPEWADFDEPAMEGFAGLAIPESVEPCGA